MSNVETPCPHCGIPSHVHHRSQCEYCDESGCGFCLEVFGYSGPHPQRKHKTCTDETRTYIPWAERDQPWAKELAKKLAQIVK